MPYRPPTDIDPIARALIRYKKAALLGRYGFTLADGDDVEQELAMQAHLAAPKYDPARGAPARSSTAS
jgi:hypothetical protein